MIVSRLPPYLLNEAVADQTIALMLTMLRKIPQARDFIGTERMLNIRRFKRMKRGVYIINSAREIIIDSKVLLWTLKNGIIRVIAPDDSIPEPTHQIARY